MLSRPSDARPFEAATKREVRADLHFLTGRFQKAADLLWPSSMGAIGPGWTDDEIAAVLRAATHAAVVQLAHGNRSSAVHLLGHRHPRFEHTKDPEMAARVATFHAFARGLFEADGQDRQSAATWFVRAQGHAAAWRRTGFDRRSLHRASLAIDLAHATVDPAPAHPVDAARALVERATALLGDTAEDFIARVLAVEARRALARRLAGADDDLAKAEAHRALELARPLAGRGAPAWDALVDATEREAAAFACG